MYPLLCTFDTETTSLDHNDDIIQLASVFHAEDWRETITFDALCKPSNPISETSIKIHGITPEKVKDCPPPLQVAEEWCGYIEELAGEREVLFAGFNVQFDVRMVQKYLPDVVFEPIIDVMRVARRLVPDAENHRLEFIYRSVFGMKSEHTTEAHNAYCDVFMTWELLRMFCERTFMTYAQMAEWLSKPEALAICPIGKGKGKKFSEVDKSWARYMLGLDLDMDLKYSFQLALGLI